MRLLSRAATRALARVALLSLALAPLGCTIERDEEQAAGAEQASQLDRQLPIIRDPALQSYLDGLGGAIARAADDAGDTRWSFHLVNSPEINAFALPGGFVYVNRGLVARAATVSELAGVLAHEIGHVALHHSAEQMQKAQRTTAGAQLICGFTSLCDNELGRAAVNVGGNALMASFSRKDELEADSVAVEYVVRAGFDPDGIPTMFTRLLRERGEQPLAVQAWFGTHPLEERRIEQARILIAQLDPQAVEGAITDDQMYQAFRARLARLR